VSRERSPPEGDMGRVHDQVAVVTGAAHGLAWAIRRDPARRRRPAGPGGVT
jgi:hypothetical protein